MEPEDQIGISQNQEPGDTSNASISSFLIVLDKRRADVATIKSWQFNAQEKIYSHAVSALGNVSEIVDAYNQLMSNYLSNTKHANKWYNIIKLKKSSYICI